MDTNIQKYAAFVKVVDCGSFTKAAESLSYTQSGISRMIGDLEREWKVILLERDRNGVRLTPDGERLLPYARKVCEEYRNLQFQVDELNGLESGMIRIGTFSSVATHWLPKMIKEFQKDYPNIEYEILLGDYREIEGWVKDGRVDCGFVPSPTDKTLDSIFLEKDELLVVLPEGHPMAACERFPVSALSDYPFMMLEKASSSDITSIFEKNGIIPNIRFTTWDDYAIMSMVESGLGIGILPKLILRRAPYRIVTKSLDVPAYRDICLIMRSEKDLSLATSRFMEYLKYRN